MYPQYFGLREPSFTLTPDPRYVLLTAQHREALAHLLYGASDNGGFVLLTGDIGTGKTTICRAFLTQLPPDVDVALVLNPALTAIELLAAICAEFALPVAPATALPAATSAYIAALNQFLLACHAAGRRPLVIIDEAQNLSPHVLEQVRLLTNLETATHKLLHIVLIGQPELRVMLAAPALRQLNQRITARFHLTPLRASDTSAYIQHRLAIAGVERPLFTRGAVGVIHRQSGGVPRLINVLCDRALLGAAVRRQVVVTAAIARQAAREIHGQMPAITRRGGRIGWLLALGAVVALTGVGIGLWLGTGGPITRPPLPIVTAPVVTTPATPSSPHSAPPVTPLPTPLTPRLRHIVPASVPDVTTAALPTVTTANVSAALATLGRYWGVTVPAAVTQCAQVAQLSPRLGCERGQHGRFSVLRQFDHPTLMLLTLTNGTAAYAVLIGLDDEYAVLALGEMQRRVPIAVLDERWSGEYLWLWQLPPVGVKLIGRSAPPAVVQWLRQQLAQWPASGLSLTAATTAGANQYDDALIAAVRRFQSANGLTADGIAGPRTLMLLMQQTARSQ